MNCKDAEGSGCSLYEGNMATFAKEVKVKVKGKIAPVP
jgi:hypothetical protein